MPEDYGLLFGDANGGCQPCLILGGCAGYNSNQVDSITTPLLETVHVNSHLSMCRDMLTEHNEHAEGHNRNSLRMREIGHMQPPLQPYDPGRPCPRQHVPWLDIPPMHGPAQDRLSEECEYVRILCMTTHNSRVG